MDKAKLIQSAIDYQKHSYAPYSHYNVSAADKLLMRGDNLSIMSEEKKSAEAVEEMLDLTEEELGQVTGGKWFDKDGNIHYGPKPPEEC